MIISEIAQAFYRKTLCIFTGDTTLIYSPVGGRTLAIPSLKINKLSWYSILWLNLNSVNRLLYFRWNWLGESNYAQPCGHLLCCLVVQLLQQIWPKSVLTASTVAAVLWQHKRSQPVKHNFRKALTYRRAWAPWSISLPNSLLKKRVW